MKAWILTRLCLSASSSPPASQTQPVSSQTVSDAHPGCPVAESRVISLGQIGVWAEKSSCYISSSHGSESRGNHSQSGLKWLPWVLVEVSVVPCKTGNRFIYLHLISQEDIPIRELRGEWRSFDVCNYRFHSHHYYLPRIYFYKLPNHKMFY